MLRSASLPNIRFGAIEPLHVAERDALVRLAQEHFQLLLARAACAPLGNDNMRMVTAPQFHAVATIHATLDEVKDAFFCEHGNGHGHGMTPLAMREVARSQQRVYALLEPSYAHPMRMAAVQWVVLRAPYGLARTRDFVCVEYMDAFIDAQGRRGWARCLQSIEHRNCPPLYHSHRLVRAHVQCSGSIYMETDVPDMLQVVTVLDIETRGLPVWMAKSVAVRMVQPSTQIEHLVRLSRVLCAELEEDGPKRAYGLGTGQHPGQGPGGRGCCGCGDRLALWETTCKCMTCRKWLCRNCREMVFFDLADDRARERICVHCMCETAGEREPAILRSGSGFSMPMPAPAAFRRPSLPSRW